jgi:hypothetical protein
MRPPFKVIVPLLLGLLPLGPGARAEASSMTPTVPFTSAFVGNLTNSSVSQFLGDGQYTESGIVHAVTLLLQTTNGGNATTSPWGPYSGSLSLEDAGSNATATFTVSNLFVSFTGLDWTATDTATVSASSDPDFPSGTVFTLSYGGTFAPGDVSVQGTLTPSSPPVPEPVTLVLFGLGASLLAASRRRPH